MTQNTESRENFFTLHTEEIFIEYALHNEEFYTEHRPCFDPEFFRGEEHIRIVKAINSHYAKYGEKPARDQLRAQLGLERVGNPDYTEAAEGKGLEWASDTIRDFAQYKKAGMSLETSFEYLDSGEYDKIYNCLDELAVADVFDDPPVFNLLDDRETILDEIREKSEGIVSTGWPSLDERISGWEPGTINAVAAATGHGKTIFLNNAMINLARQGKKVLFLSLEMRSSDIAGRVLRMMTGEKSSGKMRVDEWDRLRLALKNLPENVQKNMDILSMTSPTASEIAAMVKRLRKKGRVYDAVVMDYMDLCEPDDKTVRRDQIWMADRAMTWELKNFAEKENLIFVTAFQANRNLDNRKPGDEYTASMVAGGSEKTRAATTLMFLERLDNRDAVKRAEANNEPLPQSRTTGYKIYYTKVRNGQSGGYSHMGYQAKYLSIVERDKGDEPVMPTETVPNPKKKETYATDAEKKAATYKLLNKKF